MLLEADSIGKSYGGRRVLTSASLRAHAGTVTALCGRNGAGKSTLLAIAAGWRQPDTGVVRFDGVFWLRASLPALARRGLFYLPDREILSPGIPLRRQLEVTRRRYGGDGDIGALAEGLGLSGSLDALPPRLSGGELRRSEIALAIVRQPRCLLADEPYRGISPLDAEALTRAFRGLAALGCAVVVSGHEVEMLLDAADRVLWCTGGTTCEYGTVAAARSDWRFRQEYLDQT